MFDNAEAKLFLDLIPMGVVITNPRIVDNPAVFANTYFLSMSGYGIDEIIGRNCRFMQGSDTSQHECAILREEIANLRQVVVKLRNYKKDGTLFYNELHISPIFDQTGSIEYFIGMQKDVTKEVMLVHNLNYAVKHDYLTNLASRQFIFEVINNLIHDEVEFTLVLLDLNKFKEINDTFGHAVGDLVLQFVGDTITLQLAKLDLSFPKYTNSITDATVSFASRIGGDEFLIVMPKVSDHNITIALVNKIKQGLLNGTTINDVNFSIEFSVGASVFPYDATTTSELVHIADIAMYKSKFSQMNRLVFVDEILDD